MVQSDALSRRPDHGIGEEHDNENMTLLPEELFLNLLDTDLQQRIAEAKDIDFDVNSVLQTLLNKGPNILRNDLSDWTIEETDKGNVLFYKGKNYIPKDKKLQRDILKMFHDHETAEHSRELETYNSV